MAYLGQVLDDHNIIFIVSLSSYDSPCLITNILIILYTYIHVHVQDMPNAVQHNVNVL